MNVKLFAQKLNLKTAHLNSNIEIVHYSNPYCIQLVWCFFVNRLLSSCVNSRWWCGAIAKLQWSTNSTGTSQLPQLLAASASALYQFWQTSWELSAPELESYSLSPSYTNTLKYLLKNRVKWEAWAHCSFRIKRSWSWSHILFISLFLFVKCLCNFVFVLSASKLKK